MNRRIFLKNSSTLAIPFLLNGMLAKTFGHNHWMNGLLSPAAPDNDRVLVLIQLFGGNDGLNTVVPLDGYDNYYKARQKLAIEKSKILSITGNTTIGLHPALAGLREMYDTGKLAILQSVGYPEPDFSHFRSTDIWMSGSGSKEIWHTGWLGRYLQQQHPGYPAGYPSAQTPHPLAIEIGTSTSFAFQGLQSPMGVNVVDPGNIFRPGAGLTDAVPQGKTGQGLSFLRQVADQSAAYGDVLKAAYKVAPQQTGYPANSKLAAELKTVARLIKSGLKTKIYLVNFDGFDTHAQQVNANDSSTGRHAQLLATVSEAILAFQTDLEGLGIAERVTGMTFSEFGRRIISNESLGTDHGAAAPLFVFGAKVNAGILGNNAIIPAKVTDADNIPMQADFRSVYATVLKHWLGVEPTALMQIMGKEYPLVKLFG